MTTLFSKSFQRSRHLVVTLAVLSCIAPALVGPHALAGDFVPGTIRFGVPPWPGVTVKSEIAARVLESIGYETEQMQLGTAFVFQGLENTDIDVFLGNWTPNQNGMVNKYLQEGTIKAIANNVDDAFWGIGVPEYVWDAGVRSVEDLKKYRARFEGKIYGIEKGSPMNRLITKAIDHNVAGLADWDFVSSSTAGMLLAVKRATKNHQWVAWGAWGPHWMIPAFNTKILANTTDAVLGNRVVIRTLVANSFHQAHPNVWKFFKQMQIPSAVQSEWIYDFDRKKQPLEQVAVSWINNHPRVISKWLDGVQTRNGRTAKQVFLEKYQAPQ